MFSSFTFSSPSIFICDHRLVQGWKGTRNTKGTKTGVWRASRGTVQVCHSSCASQYKNATTLLSTRQVQGRPSPPVVCQIKRGSEIGRTACSIGDATHSLHSLYFFPPALHLFHRFIHVKAERLWESVSLRQEPKQHLHPLSLLFYGRRVISLLYSEMSLLTLSFLWLRLRLAIPFVILSLCVSLTRCQSLGPSQTTALGSVSRGAGHTRWLLCSRSSTGPRSGC